MVQKEFCISDDEATSEGAVSTTVTTAAALAIPAQTNCRCNFINHGSGDSLYGSTTHKRHATTISTTTITHAKSPSHTIGDCTLAGQDSQDTLLSQALDEMMKQSANESSTEVEQNVGIVPFHSNYFPFISFFFHNSN